MNTIEELGYAVLRCLEKTAEMRFRRKWKLIITRVDDESGAVTMEWRRRYPS